jgi:serine phosphatase RsbU (regulator of sigma subunit)
MLFALTGYQFLYRIIGLMTGIPLVSILIVSVLVARQYKYAYYFIIAWTIFLIFYLASYFRLIGILPSNFLTYYGIQIGSALEMIILSMAIGHRLYDYKRIAAEVAEENVLIKNQTNEELTLIVEQRTSELKLNLSNIQKDIEMARVVQLNTLPSREDWMTSEIELAHLFLPKDRVSGDIYDIIKTGDSKYRILIVDATGHGIQAGFFTMSIRTEYERIKYEFSEPAQVLRLLNSSVFKTFGNITMLYTCFLVDIDLEQRYLSYSSAGHPAQYLYQEDRIIEMASLAHLMGFRKDFEPKSISIPLKKGCKFLFFTDGIFEVFNSDFEEFGSDRLREFFKKNNQLSGEDLIFQLFNEVNGFSSERGIDDDVTVLYFRELE